MLVICEECSKKYNVDETMMRGERARFSCYECGHVIVVVRNTSARTPKAMPEAPGGHQDETG